jgi:hypothetical protein
LEFAYDCSSIFRVLNRKSKEGRRFRPKAAPFFVARGLLHQGFTRFEILRRLSLFILNNVRCRRFEGFYGGHNKVDPAGSDSSEKDAALAPRRRPSSLRVACYIKASRDLKSSTVVFQTTPGALALNVDGANSFSTASRLNPALFNSVRQTCVRSPASLDTSVVGGNMSTLNK